MRGFWSRVQKSPWGWVLALVAGIDALWSRYLDFRDTVALGLSPEFWLSVGLVLFFVAVLIIVYQFQKQTEAVLINMGKAPEPPERPATRGPGSYLRNEKILICELASDKPVVKDKTFEDCELIGPAMIFLTGSTFMVNSSFEGSFEKTVLILREKRWLMGVVAFEDCIFKRCKFLKVGIIASPGQEEKYRKGFGEGKRGSTQPE